MHPATNQKTKTPAAAASRIRVGVLPARNHRSVKNNAAPAKIKDNFAPKDQPFAGGVVVKGAVYVMGNQYIKMDCCNVVRVYPARGQENNMLLRLRLHHICGGNRGCRYRGLY